MSGYIFLYWGDYDDKYEVVKPNEENFSDSLEDDN
jgi:hypothetical protein